MIDEIAAHRERLAQAFDTAFTLPITTEHRELRDFLAIRLGAHWYAVPVDELAGVQTKKSVRRLPDAPPHCLGLAGVRGRVAAIYDLGSLLASPDTERSGWFLQTKADPDLALFVPKSDRYLRLPEDSVAPRGEEVEEDVAVVGAVTDAGIALNVLSVGSIVARIRDQRRAVAP